MVTVGEPFVTAAVANEVGVIVDKRVGKTEEFVGLKPGIGVIVGTGELNPTMICSAFAAACLSRIASSIISSCSGLILAKRGSTL